LSYPKRDRVFPVKKTLMTEVELARLVASALRHDYGDLPSAVKQIGLQTGANLRAIRNWYEGRHAPSSIHLLRLARSSPQILQLVLEQVGGAELADAFSLLGSSLGSRENSQIPANQDQTYSEKNCTINDDVKQETIESLNRRQRWFIAQLQAGRLIKTNDICVRWKVSARTAKTDLARMVLLKLICFKGPKKTGAYILL